MFACHSGTSKRVLIPPPLGAQVVSVNEVPDTLEMEVPPQLVTKGSDAGYKTRATPSCWPPPSEPQSPEPANTVTPRAPASANASLTAVTPAALQALDESLSSQAQLIDRAASLTESL